MCITKGKTMYSISFDVNKSLYPIQALLKTAYVFVDSCYVHLDDMRDYWRISIAKKEQPIDSTAIKGEFENELIVQTVRFNVYQQTHVIREMLLGRAMSSSMVINTEDMANRYRESNVTDDELSQILSDWFVANE